MNSLRDIGNFVGIPQGSASHLNQSSIGMRLAAQLVPTLTGNQRTSMRAMISALPNLPPVTLDAQIVGPSSGEDSFQPLIRIAPSNCAIIQTLVVSNLLGTIRFVRDLGSASGDFKPTLPLSPGSWIIQVDRNGVGNSGFVRLPVMPFEITVRPKPGSPPGLTLTVTNQATAFFQIAAVSWSVERQELNGTFTLVASPSGESAFVVPPTLGQYHIHGVVSVNALQSGETIDAEFRGNATINGLHTQLVVWTGISLTENFRLFADPPSGAEVNPVVSL
jgi:hypothetical protein